MEAIGKEGKLGEEEDKKGIWRRLNVELNGKDQNMESRTRIHWLKPRNGTCFKSQILVSVPLSSFFSSVGRADKGLIVTLAARSYPLSLGEEGLLEEKTVARLENLHCLRKCSPILLGSRYEESEGAQGQLN